MQVDIRKKVLRFTTIALAIALFTTSALTQEQRAPPFSLEDRRKCDRRVAGAYQRIVWRDNGRS